MRFNIEYIHSQIGVEKVYGILASSQEVAEAWLRNGIGGDIVLVKVCRNENAEMIDSVNSESDEGLLPRAAALVDAINGEVASGHRPFLQQEMERELLAIREVQRRRARAPQGCKDAGLRLEAVEEA
tara:strand:- start:135 stop:515 length:381 start_codon:yes stop_codon:yes gene_type:complete